MNLGTFGRVRMNKIKNLLDETKLSNNKKIIEHEGHLSN